MEPVQQRQTQRRQAVEVEQPAPSPTLFFETIRAYQQSAVLKAAIDLDLFTAIAEGADTVGAIARRSGASARGIRIIADYLAVLGFLTREGNRYALTHDSFVFLNRHSPAYVGSAADFLLAPDILDLMRDFTAIVREGRSHAPSLEPNNPMWVNFAKSMAPLMTMPSQLLADLLQVSNAGPMRVLDIAAGHGLFGIAVATQNPAAEIVAVDWQPVLEVARTNAAEAGVAGRYRTVAGDAMKVDVGKDYNLVLLTNFLHHFDEATSITFLKKVRGALRDGGRVAALEFVPDEDRTSPAPAVAFSVTMLAITPAGDAYTFSQFQRMFGEAGFRNVELHPLPPTFEQVVTAVR
jgi:ubiquinone/menaquinone biosynthesis C-methylase UbiE